MTTKLKTSRSGHRGYLTKLLQKLEDRISSEEFDKDEVSTILSAILAKQKLLLNINTQILDQISEEEIEDEISEAEDYSLNLELKICKLRKHIQPATHASTPVHESTAHASVTVNESFSKSNLSTQESSAHTSSSAPPLDPRLNPNADNFNMNQTSSFNSQPQYMYEPTQSNSSHFHKLPKLEMKKFDGNLLNWQPFWDSYKTAVHTNCTLSDAQKFNYLQSLLLNEALDTVSGFSLTDANYAKAIELLHKRFGQTQQITHTHMQSLLDLPAPNNTVRSCRQFFDKSEQLIRGLESMGQNQETYGAFLIPIMLNKLPERLKENLNRAHGFGNWTLDKLREGIHNELCIMEASQTSIPIAEQPNRSTVYLAKTTAVQERSTKTQRTDKKACIYCGETHPPGSCNKIKDPKARREILKQKRACFNCLGNHRVSDCRSKGKCRQCGRKHHTSICESESQTPARTDSTSNNGGQTKDNKSLDQTTQKTSVMHCTTASQVLLKTAVATVNSNIGVSTDANILFDEGAQRSFITQQLASQLELDVQQLRTEAISISGFGGGNDTVRHLKTAEIYVETDEGETINLNVLIVPEIASPIRTHSTDITRLPYLRHLKLAHSFPEDEAFNITLLIGADYYWDFVQDTIVRGDGPTAVKSRIGYLLSGPTRRSDGNKNATMLNVLTSHKVEEYDLEKFWNIESLGIMPTDKERTQKEYLENYMETNVTYDGTKYNAKLPWKDDHNPLPSNFEVTKRRTESVIRRLSKDNNMLVTYGDIIKEQEKRDFIEKVDNTIETSGNVHYIPHHPVKKESATTPIRIVYDCSCRQSPDSPSLNDCLRKDPPILNDISTLLLQFRETKYAVVTDIEKAFLQIKLDERDRDMTRFLWLSDPTDPTSELTTYRFKSVLFGATCSPFILNATLLKHLQENWNETADKLKQGLYVDNVIAGFDTNDELCNFYSEARALMTKGGFNLRSWASNSDKLNQHAKMDNVHDEDICIKVLGLKWNKQGDKIEFGYKEPQISDKSRITKRVVLQESSKIYDPLGVLSPVTIRSKVFLQDLWNLKLGWDDTIPFRQSDEWLKINADLRSCKKIEFNRTYFTDMDTEKHEAVLHVFTDASMSAYGACAYLVKGQESTFVMAKSRVAPIKKLTIPQLELMAALIGARLASHVLNSLRFTDKCVLWSDSQIVLHWIHSKKQLKTFIANRITEIKELTYGHRWRYCPTEHNPADLLSRGLTYNQLSTSDLWKHGPTWLSNMENWPKEFDNKSTVLITVEDNEEEPKTNQSEHKHNQILNIVDPERYSSFHKVVRIVAYIQRFVTNCRVKPTEKCTSNLTSKELGAATQDLLRAVQHEKYGDVINCLTSNTSHQLIRQLRLYIDDEGLVRCRGRINNAPLPLDARYPILLPPKHRLTFLLISDIHVRNMHSGIGSTVTLIRQCYWIPSLRQEVGYIIRKCVNCRKVTGRAYQAPEPPPLPKDRLSLSPPFTVSGVDFSGALHVRGDHGKDQKVYVCLFTCANTRAIHLEVVPDMTEDSFLLAFRRFVGRKSIPKVIISDNATTFVAAAEDIRKLTESKSLNDKLSEYGTTWKFIPSRAPWYGGFWERLVGLTKNCLRKTLGRAYIDLSELQTMAVEIEAHLNNRPLTYVSTDISDPEPLTPSHLLYGRNIQSFPLPHLPSDDIMCDKDLSGDHTTLNNQVKRRFQIVEQFVMRWKHEYLTALREFHRTSGKQQQNIKVGEIVQIYDDNLPRTAWKLGIIEELVYGKDNLIRSAKVRTKNAISSRPIVKLYPLEICDTERDEQQNSIVKPERRAKRSAMENIRKWIK